MRDNQKREVPLTGRKKAALLLLAIGPDSAAEIYRHLSDTEIEQITLEVANSGNISQEKTAKVIEEFYHTAMAKQYISHGGLQTAREILEKALGPGKAMEIIENLQGMLTGNPFDFLKHVDLNNLLNFLQHEHPQTIALILSHLNDDAAAGILSALEPEIQKDVALRIATMDQTNPEIISEIERILEKKMATMLSQEYTPSGGIDSLAELLNRVDRSTSRTILDSLETENQELASEIKKQMFTFDDLVMLNDRTLQKVLQGVNMKDMAAALKGATDEVRTQILGNVSSRMAQTLVEDMELMGPVRIQTVEESQQKIINLIRAMEENGEIDSLHAADEEYIG